MLAEVARVERCVAVRGAPRPPLLDAGGMRVSVKSPDAAEGSLVAESRSMTWRRTIAASTTDRPQCSSSRGAVEQNENHGVQTTPAKVISLRILDITLVVEI